METAPAAPTAIVPAQPAEANGVTRHAPCG